MSGCSSVWPESSAWNREVVGSNPTAQTICGSGEAGRHVRLRTGFLVSVGSSPSFRTKFPCSSAVEWVTVNHLTLVRFQAREPAAGSSMVEHHSDKVVVAGSTPALPTIAKVCSIVVVRRSPKPLTGVRFAAGLPNVKEEKCW